MLSIHKNSPPPPRPHRSILIPHTAILFRQQVPSRIQFSQQMANIQSMHLFARSNSKKIAQLKPSNLYDNPQSRDRDRQLNKNLPQTEKKKQQSRIQTVSVRSNSSRVRKNTFLTVVSRLPQCKKRSESTW